MASTLELSVSEGEAPSSGRGSLPLAGAVVGRAVDHVALAGLRGRREGAALDGRALLTGLAAARANDSELARDGGGLAWFVGGGHKDELQFVDAWIHSEFSETPHEMCCISSTHGLHIRE